MTKADDSVDAPRDTGAHISFAGHAPWKSSLIGWLADWLLLVAPQWLVRLKMVLTNETSALLLFDPNPNLV